VWLPRRASRASGFRKAVREPPLPLGEDGAKRQERVRNAAASNPLPPFGPPLPKGEGAPLHFPKLTACYSTDTFPALSAASTRSGRNGTRRSRTPVASKIAFATAASVGLHDASPAP